MRSFTSAVPIESPVERGVCEPRTRISLEEIGGWPWSREYFATVAKALVERAGVKALGMDFVFSDDGVAESVDLKKLIAGNRALGGFLLHTPSVVVAASYTAGDFRDDNGKKKIVNFRTSCRTCRPWGRKSSPRAACLHDRARPHVGPPGEWALIDTVDAGTRLVRLYAPTSVRTYYAMAVELALVYYGADRLDIKITDDHMDIMRPDGDARDQDSPLQEARCWRSIGSPGGRMPPTIPEVGMSTATTCTAKMLDSDDEAARGRRRRNSLRSSRTPSFCLAPRTRSSTTWPQRRWMTSRCRRSASTGTCSRRSFRGPLPAPSPRVGRLCRHLRSYPPSSRRLAARAAAGQAVFAKVMAVLSRGRLRRLRVCSIFKTSGFHHPGGGASIGAAITTQRRRAPVADRGGAEAEEGRIKGMFGTCVSPAVVESMVNSGRRPEKLGGSRGEHHGLLQRHIQSFSSFSEKLSPTLLVELMNQYLTVCLDSIQGGRRHDRQVHRRRRRRHLPSAPLQMSDHARGQGLRRGA